MGGVVFLVDGHVGGITDLAFSPAGEKLVSSCSEGTVTRHCFLAPAGQQVKGLQAGESL
tara:strand:+ start:112 stop:288 length:177 start_codon:yes stop_codon:yes gene_type:complete